MKYLILVCDGMADRKIKELGDRTPMEAAKTTPWMRWHAFRCAARYQTFPREWCRKAIPQTSPFYLMTRASIPKADLRLKP